MKAIPTSQIRAIESVRENRLRSAEWNTLQDEIICAKQIRQQTGCTWTEALRAAASRERASP